MTTIALLAAMDRNRAIGVDGKLPWHLPDDLKRFKARTLNSTILMGRKTAEAIGRPLPQRRNLVMTRTSGWNAPGFFAVPDLDTAIEIAGEELIVIGGGEIYTLAMERATDLWLTFVDAEVGADTWFPDFDPSEWRETESEAHAADEKHEYAFEFVDFERAG